MMQELEFYHGAVFARIIRFGKQASIGLLGSGNAAYTINDNTGIYVKHSTNRLTPWSFSFSREHMGEIRAMKHKCDSVFLVLVCNKDGVACLSFKELAIVLDSEHDSPGWIRISRRPREKYTVSGSNGVLKYKIGDNQFPSRLLSHN